MAQDRNQSQYKRLENDISSWSSLHLASSLTWSNLLSVPRCKHSIYRVLNRSKPVSDHCSCLQDGPGRHNPYIRNRQDPIHVSLSYVPVTYPATEPHIHSLQIDAWGPMHWSVLMYKSFPEALILNLICSGIRSISDLRPISSNSNRPQAKAYPVDSETELTPDDPGP